jgi:prepilin-type N-terminal cleavage/methylation domain-containing protein
VRPPARVGNDAGFTLIETLIAMIIMSIAVITIVGALTTMITLTSEHRGHAVVEAAARSFSQAVEGQGQFTTKLTAAATSTTTTLTVADASLVPPGSDDTLPVGSPPVDPGDDTFVIVDREVMHVKHVDRATNELTVDRHITGTATTHAASAAVATFTRCGLREVTTPDPTTYQSTPGLVVAVAQVEYWSVTGNDWTDRAGCLNDYTTLPSKCATATGGTILPDCTTVRRVTVSIKSSDTSAPGGYDPRLRNVDTTTQVLVRRGSA